MKVPHGADATLMPPLEQIHRVAHCAIHDVGESPFQSSPHGWSDFCSFRERWRETDHKGTKDLGLSHAVPGRVRQVGFREAEIFTEAFLQFQDFGAE